MFTIVTIRFNNETLDLNYKNRIKRGQPCIYASPHEMSPNIYLNAPVFVIEMNNSTNKIEGIGLIKNKPTTDKYYKIQETQCYNRYVYFGKYHVDRASIELYNPYLVYVLDQILFKGYTHSKRGAGFTTIPEKVLTFDICKDIDIKKEIRNLFIYRFRENPEVNKSVINKL
jgi:hypothetical protein